MTDFVTYMFLPTAIEGAPMEPDTQVELRVIATVRRLSGWPEGTFALRIDDWAGPTARNSEGAEA